MTLPHGQKTRREAILHGVGAVQLVPELEDMVDHLVLDDPLHQDAGLRDRDPVRELEHPTDLALVLVDRVGLEPLGREVVARHADARLRFFGQGASEPAIRAEAAKVGDDRIVLGGVVPPAEAAEWIRGAAAALVSIVPGIGYDFARPTKTYAAAACGAPVIFAGTGSGAALVRDHGLGEAVPFTPEAVADAMIRAIDAWRSGPAEPEGR